MFGYVTADKPNMLIKDFAEYRAYYCGLCKEIGRRYKRQAARFFINYDVTFLTILAHNYRKVQPTIKEERCVAHPVGKKFSVVQSDEVQGIIVDINTLLGYYKLEDNVLDDGGVKYRTVRAYCKPMFNKAAKRFPDLSRAISDNYQRLRIMENEGTATLDEKADTFATILKAVGRTATGASDDNLDTLCYYLGRWIYIIDAYDDLARDIRDGKFNPLINKGETLTTEREAEIYSEVEFSLKSCIKFIREAYDNMDITVSEGALSNVIYCGLRLRTETVLKDRGAKCKITLL